MVAMIGAVGTSQGQDAVNAAVETQVPSQKKKKSAIEKTITKEDLTGASVKFFRSESPFRILSPLAPESDGKAEENQGDVAIDKARPGFKGIVFVKLSW